MSDLGHSVALIGDAILGPRHAYETVLWDSISNPDVLGHEAFSSFEGSVDSEVGTDGKVRVLRMDDFCKLSCNVNISSYPWCHLSLE